MTLALASRPAASTATRGQRALAAGIALFLLIFLALPTAMVIFVGNEIGRAHV